MVQKQVSKLMMEYVYRDVITDIKTQKVVADSFFEAETPMEAVNVIGFGLGLVEATDQLELRKFQSEDLFEPKIRKQLAAILKRMPSLHFMFIPLAMVEEKEGFTIVPLLRVRKPSKIPGQAVYLDTSLRVYDTFQQFLEDNKLPPCELWYPTDGLVRFDESGDLLLSSCIIKKRYTGVVKNAITAVNIAATGLVLTPFAPVAAPILLVASSVPLFGISIAELVDSCKYERGTVIASRSAAMVVNLVTFSSVGLTAASKASKLRNLLSPEKLALLEKAEMAMNVTSKTASSVNVVYAVIGSVAGWQHLTVADWVQVAANLCFAYHKVISEENAKALFQLLQVDGVVKFFQNICPNLIVAVARPKVERWLDTMLKMVFEFLEKEEVKFSVDDDFTTICLFGYELKFETLVQLKIDAVLSLLQYLKSYIVPIRQLNAGSPFTKNTLCALMELIRLVYQLPNVPLKLNEYITVGKGHNFSFDDLIAWWKAPADRKEILKEMASLSEAETEQLNEIRATRLAAGGDAALFRWLKVPGALRNFMTIANKTGKEPIVFDDTDLIVVNNLLSLSAEECSRCSSLEEVLNDTRFLQLCKDAEDQSNPSEDQSTNLVQRAKTVWLHTCRYSPINMQLETVSLLEKLFTYANASSPPLTLADALDYALDFDGATVGTIYYGILFAWRVLVEEKHTKFDAAAMRARFHQLMLDAGNLQMNRSMTLQADNQTVEENDENARLIAIVRQGTRFIHYGESCKMEELYFNTKERAACFLQLFPALRHKAGRDQFNSTLRYLLKKGDAQVLLHEESRAKHIQFYRGKMKVVFEMLPVDNNRWSVSVELCSLSFRTQSNPDGKNALKSKKCSSSA